MSTQTIAIRARRESRSHSLGLAGQPPRWALGGVVAAELGAFYAILNGNGWVFDDNLSMELARRDGFNHYWLASNLFGHFEPAHRAVYSLLSKLMPIDARYGLVAQLVVLAFSIVLLERSLRMILGGGWVPLVAAAYFGFSVLLVPQLQWLSSGLEAIPTLAAELLCIWAYLHFQRERRVRWVLVCAGALAAGLAFYEKPVLVVLYLVLIRLLLAPGRLHAGRSLRALANDWPIWLALGAVIAVYIAGREAFGAGSIASGGSAPLSEWVSLARVFWVQTLAPALFNFRLPAAGLSSVQVSAAVAAQVALLAVIVASLIHRRIAWRAWLALGICVVATFVIVGEGRLATFGPSVGNDPRYLTEFAWLVPFMAALAWCAPAKRDDPGSERQDGSSVARGAGPRVLMPVLAAMALASYALAGTFTSVRIQRDWLGSQARRWEANVEASLRAVHRNRRRVVIVNNVVPWYIVDSAFPPFNGLSYVLPFYGGAVQIDGPLDGQLLAFTSTGRLRRVTLPKPVAASPPLTDKCGAAGPAGRTVRWIWSAHAVRLIGSTYLLITYDSIGLDRVPVYVDHGGGGFGPYRLVRQHGSTTRVSFPPDAVAALDARAHTSVLWLGPAPALGVQLSLSPEMGVCIKRLAIAQLEAAPGT